MATLTAGFDLVAQLSADAIKQILQSRAPIPGLGLQNLRTPFTLNAPAGPSPSLTLNVDDVQVQLAKDAVHLIFVFKQGQFQLPKSSTVPISGRVTLTLPFALADVVPPPKVPSKTLRLQMKQASATCDLAGGALQSGLVGGVMTDQLRLQPDYDLPVRLKVVPGQGSLRSFRFSSVQVRTLDAFNIIGLFGRFAGTGGDPSSLAGTLLQAGENVGLALSADAFQSQLICPMMAQALGLEVAQLPTSCGTGQPTVSIVTMRSFTTTFTPGSLQVDVLFTRSTSQYSLTCKVHGSVSLDVQNTAVLPRVHWSDPDVDTELKGMAKLVSYVIPVVGITAGVLSLIADTLVSVVGGKLLNDLTDDVPPLDLSNIVQGLPMSVGHAAIQPGGIALGGSVTMKPGTKQAALVDVAGSTDVQPIGEGTPEPVKPALPIPSSTYTATNYACNSVATYGVKTQQVALGYQLAWTLTTNDGAVVGVGNGFSTMTLKNVSATFNAGNGAAMSVVKDVVVTVSPNGSQIVLTNRPEDGNYSVLLTATLTWPDGSTRTSVEQVEMTGYLLVMPPEYDAAMDRFNDWMRQIGGGRAVRTPRKPNPGDIRKVLQNLVSQPGPEAAGWLSVLPVLAGSSFDRAVRPASVARLALADAGFKRVIDAPVLHPIDTDIRPR